MKGIFITGAGGFIGSHVTAHFASRARYQITALYRRPTAVIRGVKAVVGELRDVESYREALLACDACVHLAGTIDINASLEAPRERIDENVAILLDMLEALRINKRTPLFVFASTDRVYGRTTRKTVTELDPPAPIEPYTASKMLGETILQMYGMLYGIPYIILRLDSVYGPGQPRSMFISDVIQKMLTSHSITTGNLALRKNFVYVEDVARAIEASVRAPRSARSAIYNIGGESVSMSDVLETAKSQIERMRGVKIEVTSSTDRRPSAIEVRPFALSTARARDFLKWTPRTTLKSGLTKTIDYFQQRHI